MVLTFVIQEDTREDRLHIKPPGFEPVTYPVKRSTLRLKYPVRLVIYKLSSSVKVAKKS